MNKAKTIFKFSGMLDQIFGPIYFKAVVPKGVPRHPKVPFTIPRGAAS